MRTTTDIEGQMSELAGKVYFDLHEAENDILSCLEKMHSKEFSMEEYNDLEEIYKLLFRFNSLYRKAHAVIK